LPELPPAIDIGGLSLVPVTRGELIDTLVARAKHRVRTTVHYLNAHVFNLSRRDPALQRMLATCDLLYADGNSIAWAARLMGYSIPGRLTSADYFHDFCRQCAAGGLGLFLLGGAAGVAEIAADRLTRRIPGLRIVGTSHGYLSERESVEVAGRIRDSGADVLIVGLSSPTQETWIHRHGPLAGVPVQWAVGALLDYVAGAERRAPQWLRRCGCEWLFRLLVNPRGRWRRYVLGNVRFAWWVAAMCLLPHRGGDASNIGRCP
jgi:N-acetylglucosaminyldiphosphoundecaprenol N-acetyl-beta-D-mannosaminyltransferase